MVHLSFSVPAIPNIVITLAKSTPNKQWHFPQIQNGFCLAAVQYKTRCSSPCVHSTSLTNGQQA